MGFAFEFYIQSIWLNEIVLCVERLFNMVDFTHAQRDYLSNRSNFLPKRDTYSFKIDENWKRIRAIQKYST